MKKLKVSKQSYLRLEGEKLVNYAQNLLAQCEAQPAFAVVASQIAAVKTAVEDFDATLPDAVNGGRDRLTRKKHALDFLLDKLDQLVGAVEVARLPAEVMERGGFELASGRRSFARTELNQPVIQSARQLGNGAIEIRFAVPDRQRIHTNAFEWSADGGVTWQNGGFGRRSPLKLGGLPARQDVLIRAFSVGSHGRKSELSLPFSVFVL
jgi:hypothetical protein